MTGSDYDARRMRTTDVMQDALAVVLIPQPRKGRGARAKCKCCGKKQTHHLFANGICMGFEGCEVSVWRCKRNFEQKRGYK